MKRALEVFQKSILAIVIVSSIAWITWLAIATQPAYATISDRDVTTLNNQSVESREEAYEKEVKIGDQPQDIQKEYKENLKEFKKENPDQGGLVEGAKKLVEKATGKE